MKILIIVQSEVCYHPRLLKAGDFFHANHCEVTLYNAIIGLASNQLYRDVIKKRDWKIFETDISKANRLSKFKWLVSSLFFKLNQYAASKTGRYISFKYGLTKSFLFFPTHLKNQKFDYILINLVDALPFAISVAQKTGAKVIYDSQEYFKGQYAQLSLQQYNWVKKAENNFVKHCPIILATTHVMKERLQKDFVSNALYYRVRNVPVKNCLNITKTQTATLKLAWHGLNIVPENIRGVHIILQAISICTTNVHLYLQGNISVKNKEILEEKLKQLNIISKVTVMPPANPDAIVESLVSYDIGIAGELAAEENQQLTSSNKLFEYIAAGMAVIMPNLPGLIETVEEYKNGILYQQGNAQDLANAIDQLNNNRNLLQQYQKASLKAIHEELFWEHEMAPVFEKMQDLKK